MISLLPQPDVTEAERERGLRLMIGEAGFSGGTAALTTGVILTAFALHLGASNAMVGLLAAAPFLAQLLQLPAILLIERTRQRKRIAVLSSVVGRSMLAVMAVIAFFSGTAALLAFLVAQIVVCGLGAIGGCAWNAWIRDLAPERQLGNVSARRTIWTTSISLALGLAAAAALRLTPDHSLARDAAFAAMFAIGCITGLISARIVAAMPEPQMAPLPGRLSLIELLGRPLRDANFSRLLRFMASWQFAANFATPFFTVFIVRRLGFDVSFVLILNMISQIANLVALRTWGALSDRFANKSVLAVCAPTYILAIAAMVGASQFADERLVTAWLVMLHIVMGASIAGVTLATTNIALKLSPKGEATAYVAVNAMVTAVAAGLAPIIGGLLADVFAARQLELVVRWTSPYREVVIPFVLSHWDFYFLLAGMIGLYAVHRLSLVREQGEIERHEMVAEVLNATRRSVRNISSVAGLRGATDLPASLIREARLRLRFLRRRAREKTRRTALRSASVNL